MCAPSSGRPLAVPRWDTRRRFAGRVTTLGCRGRLRRARGRAMCAPSSGRPLAVPRWDTRRRFAGRVTTLGCRGRLRRARGRAMCAPSSGRPPSTPRWDALRGVVAPRHHRLPLAPSVRYALLCASRPVLLLVCNLCRYTIHQARCSICDKVPLVSGSSPDHRPSIILVNLAVPSPGSDEDRLPPAIFIRVLSESNISLQAMLRGV